MLVSLTRAVLATLLASEPGALADYGAASEQIGALERDGKFVRAARAAESLGQAYPQDYTVALWSGWLRFQAHHYGRATRHYERAVQLSSGSIESRLGLAWSLLYDGRRSAATGELEALEGEAPESAEVQEALRFARARAPVAATPWASGTAHIYGDHPSLRSGFGVQGGLRLRIAEHFAVGASYGFARIAYDEPVVDTADTARANGSGGGSGGAGPGGTGGNGSGGTGSGGNGSGNMNQAGRGVAEPVQGGAVEQHQAHVSAGPVWPIAGGLVQYGYLRDEGVGPVHALGLSLRYSPWGDLVLDTSVTVEGNVHRPRYAPSWRMPVHRNVWLRPGVAVQTEDGEALTSGSLTLAVHGRPGAVWVGGKYGPERRPAYLGVPLIFNLQGDLRWGGWAGGQVSLPAGIAVFSGYEIHGVDAVSASGTSPSLAHYLTIGLSFSHS